MRLNQTTALFIPFYLILIQGDCKVVKRRVCNGQVHKVRDDGTKITCSNGKFEAIKGRKGKAAEDEGETVDSECLRGSGRLAESIL